jgi:CheY-like chemotaxis protein
MHEHRCLIVEDEPEWQERFERACIQRSFTDEQIRVAGDKAKALVQLEEWLPDIVILDLAIESREGQGDVHERNGRDVLQRIHALNQEGPSRTVVLIVSGVIDDYDRQKYEDDSCVVRAVNKDDVGDALPVLLKRAQKLALPLLREVKAHWPEVFPKFERLMKDSVHPKQALSDAYDIADAMLINLGQGIMGAAYPIQSGRDDVLFYRIEILRGHLAKVERSPYVGKASTEVWIEGMPYQHLHTIRNYCNCEGHYRKLTPSGQHRCPLDVTVAAEKQIFDSLENMDQAANVLRPLIQDLLSWYLPWHKRQRKQKS